MTSSRPLGSDGEKRTILLIDDDPSIREALVFALRRTYRVIVAPDAMAGVRAMSVDVSAVILDIKMEGPDGFWACEQIQKFHPHTPVIFHSAFQDLKDPYEVINQHRPFAYIVKGHPEQLFDAIARAITLHDRLLEYQDVLACLDRVQERMKLFRK